MARTQRESFTQSIVSTPSVNTIVKRLDLPKEVAKQIRALMDGSHELTPEEMENLPNRGREAELIMEKIAQLIPNNFGVECIRDADYWDRYYTDNRIMYINMGDTYIETILFDTKHNKYIVSCWGDYIERLERYEGANFK